MFVEICVDYVYYLFESFVICYFGWFDDEFKVDYMVICWVLSFGSNCVFEYLNSGVVDFGLVVGLVLVFVCVNGNLIYMVYVFLCFEWMVLVVCKDLLICLFVDFKGKKIVVMCGIDLFLFMLCVLYMVGLICDDVEIVNL